MNDRAKIVVRDRQTSFQLFDGVQVSLYHEQNNPFKWASIETDGEEQSVYMRVNLLIQFLCAKHVAPDVVLSALTLTSTPTITSTFTHSLLFYFNHTRTRHPSTLTHLLSLNPYAKRTHRQSLSLTHPHPPTLFPFFSIYCKRLSCPIRL